MNCKPGDLAIYVGKQDAVRGYVVKVVRQGAPGSDVPDPVPGVWWEVAPPIPLNGKKRRFAADCALLPIRDPGDEATDEMVQLLGNPSEVTA